MNWLDEAERRDPAYGGGLDWHCPLCGDVLAEADGGLVCAEHGHMTWAQLSASDTGD